MKQQQRASMNNGDSGKSIHETPTRRDDSILCVSSPATQDEGSVVSVERTQFTDPVLAQTTDCMTRNACACARGSCVEIGMTSVGFTREVCDVNPVSEA